jgi:TPR repeat protein
VDESMSQKNPSGCLAMVFAIFVVCCFFGWLLNVSDHPQPASIPSLSPPATAKNGETNTDVSAQENAKAEFQTEIFEAYAMAKESVKSKLSAPSTAKFSSLGFDTEAKAGPYGYHQWLVSGFVDSQNGFGAMLRNNWGAVMVKTDVGWRTAYLQIADNSYGALPIPAPFPLTPEQLAAQKAAQRAAAEKLAADKKAGYERALKYNQDLADKGDAYGLLRMGERYRDGEGVDKDLKKAREYFTKALAAGSPEAEAELNKLPKP